MQEIVIVPPPDGGRPVRMFVTDRGGYGRTSLRGSPLSRFALVEAAHRSKPWPKKRSRRARHQVR